MYPPNNRMDWQHCKTWKAPNYLNENTIYCNVNVPSMKMKRIIINFNMQSCFLCLFLMVDRNILSLANLCDTVALNDHSITHHAMVCCVREYN